MSAQKSFFLCPFDHFNAWSASLPFLKAIADTQYQNLIALKRFTLVQSWFFFYVMYLVHFPAGSALILFLSIFGNKIGVLKCLALFQGKELQVTRLKVICF